MPTICSDFDDNQMLDTASEVSRLCLC